jgi:hypothetical protein
MKSYYFIFLVMTAGVLLTACGNTAVKQETISDPQPAFNDDQKAADPKQKLAQPEVILSSISTVEQVEESSGDLTKAQWPDGDLQLDEQGSVEVTITPINLNASGTTLDFSVGLNTHSVDLGMDLAPLAILETDNGLGVQASMWDAPRGGHHVSGILSFPTTADGVNLLEGASHLTLKLHEVDAPERSFSWSLTG